VAKLRAISPEVFDAELREILMNYALTCGDRLDELSMEAVERLVSMTKSNAPRGHRDPKKKIARPRFHVTIAYKKLEASWFGASRYIWYVKKPNYRLTHLIAKSRRLRNNRVVPGNPFLQNALDTVLRDYEAAIRRYFIE